MHMIGEPYEETDLDLVVALLGPGEGPDDDLVHQGTGTEQETAVEGTAGDLHTGSSFWDESDSSAHHPQKTENRSRNLLVLEPLGFARGVGGPFRLFRTSARVAGGHAAGLEWNRLAPPVGTSGGGTSGGGTSGGGLRLGSGVGDLRRRDPTVETPWGVSTVGDAAGDRSREV